MNWLNKAKADIVCLQEIKASPEQLDESLLNHSQYYSYFNAASKKGYSGVAVFTKERPLKVQYKLGFERFDSEGRIIRLDFQKFILVNPYLPHGGRQKENLGYKLMVYKKLFDYLAKLKNKNVILIGDFNVAHHEIDLARPKQNQNNIMFTPAERKKIDNLLEQGFIDTFREFHKEGGNYTWWPYMANARERNLGWRIDYIFVSKNLDPKVKRAFILSKVKGSDHCPIGIEL